MGNYENKAPGGPEMYNMKAREIRIMNEIWKSLENDLVYYGTQFFTTLFHNHPEYFKFFQEIMPHEFQVDVPTMRSKFSLTCGTLAALFGEYSHKSKAREHLLGYVAMVHKDMNLTQKDMENFMMTMMEMLMKKFPKLMTADCCLAYVRYTASLTSRLHILMKKMREVSRLSNGFNESQKKKYPMIKGFRSLKCNWLPCNHEVLIYGRTPEYWEKKNRHWIVQRAVWATMNREDQAGSSRRDTIAKSSIVNFSQISSIETSTSSDAINDGENERKMKTQSTRKKKHFRKLRNIRAESNDVTTDVDSRFTPKSNDYRLNQLNRGRSRRVSIVGSSARERRRISVMDGVGVKKYLRPTETRRLTIQNGKTSLQNNEESSSQDEIEGRDFEYNNLQKSPDVDTDKIKNRGTSISNVSEQSHTLDENKPKEGNELFHEIKRPRASFSVKNDPPSGIIAAGTSGSRGIAKRNKRVSISSAQWFASRDLNNN